KNKELAVTWEHFTSKLQPGQKETWTAVVAGPAAEKSVAEMVATLYDESLDAFAPHNWQRGFGVFREDFSTAQAQFLNFGVPFNPVFGQWNRPMEDVKITYRHFPSELTENLWGYRYLRPGRMITRLHSRGMSEDENMAGAPPSSMPAMEYAATATATGIASDKLALNAGSLGALSGGGG